MGGEPERIGFFLVENFSMMSLAAAIEPLRSANRQLGRDAYSWCYLSLDGAEVRASNGMTVSTCGSIREFPKLDYLFACAGTDTDPAGRPAINAALQRMRQQTIKLGAISGGTFILARAGIIRDARCTVHWEYLPAFQQEFPAIRAENALFVFDKDLYTSSGGLASADMMLHRITETHGGSLARAVGNQFQIDRIREPSEAQRSGALDRLVTLPPSLQKVVTLMLANIEEPLSIGAITTLSETPPRQLERLFKAWLGCSPLHFYRARRLEKAHELLIHTNLPLIEIAQMTGFAGHSQFSAAYRSHFGKAPNASRRNSRFD
ncbi:GlxA family transcriptional regulator [Aurantimonas sp. A3-2-R12]|uniref:GlxA family transcriptional regulator n=1 Tax=Aurantimonas sp. A3-2-R12 TaxID=3114362 RepID=UPI002E18F5AF|nr:GlxA family transcriptional regulator [Aurantimonas sp. A3-2-R12]